MNKIFGLNFYENSLENMVKELEMVIKSDEKVKVYTPNVDHIINIKQDENVFVKYRAGDYIIADGWPVVAVGKMKKKKVFRITGVDLMDELLKIADEKNLSIFILGATEETLIKLKNNLRENYKGIKNITYNDGYFTENENKKLIEKINKSNSQILFVGMGSPKQELWITENSEKLDVNIAIAIGGALKIYSNEVERAPKIIQNIGMEWFYRFLKEPSRLFHRYFIKYPQFIKYFIKELVGD